MQKRYRWAHSLLGGCLAGLALVEACSGKVTPGGGLMLRLATDMATPTEFDAVHITVEQQLSNGAWSKPLVDQAFPTPSTTSLPATYSIASGQSADQVVFIAVAAIKTGQTVVSREVQVQVPRTRRVELDIFLSRSCIGKTCGLGQTCMASSDGAAMCAPPLIDESTLPGYPVSMADAGGGPDSPSSRLKDQRGPDMDADAGASPCSSNGTCTPPDVDADVGEADDSDSDADDSEDDASDVDASDVDASEAEVSDADAGEAEVSDVGASDVDASEDNVSDADAGDDDTNDVLAKVVPTIFANVEVRNSTRTAFRIGDGTASKDGVWSPQSRYYFDLHTADGSPLSILCPGQTMAFGSASNGGSPSTSGEITFPVGGGTAHVMWSARSSSFNGGSFPPGGCDGMGSVDAGPVGTSVRFTNGGNGAVS
ncbi:MAG TPA: hypothetical protein VGY54_13435, partial [Polyangiaceae bacterium]|nr:hypothetical protein [Polyangiaceae bacterium]